MRIPAKTKEDWLAALRSGDYPKGTERLHRNGQWCCLGVLCDILKVSWTIQEIEGEQCRCYGHAHSIIPPQAWPLVGVTAAHNSKEFFFHENNLIRLNDQSDSFDQVIRYIEEHL